MKKQIPYLWSIVVAILVVAAFFILIVWGPGLLTSPTNTPATQPAAVAVPDLLPAPAPAPKPILSHYIEIISGCGPYYDVAPCVNMRSGPSEHSSVEARLRTGVVLKVEAATTERDGRSWYKIIFDQDIRYPERVSGDWYVAVDSESVRPFDDVGDVFLNKKTPDSTAKIIVVDLSSETLYAYDESSLFMQVPISTGLELTPTPKGVFTIFKKTPSRYMQGPLPGVSDQYYDLPGVPWNLYFTGDGAVIHGAYWHDHFGTKWSHGCVNLSLEDAKKLYAWANVGTKVIVRN